MRTPIVILSCVAILVIGVDAFALISLTTPQACGLCFLGPLILLAVTYPFLGLASTLSAGILALINAVRARRTIWVAILAGMLLVCAIAQYWIVTTFFGVFPLLTRTANGVSLIEEVTLPSMVLLAVLAVASSIWPGRSRAPSNALPVSGAQPIERP